MKLRFQLIIACIFVVLVCVCVYQGYWLYSFYRDQYAKMEVDIMTSMRNADEQMIQTSLAPIHHSSFFSVL